MMADTLTVRKSTLKDLAQVDALLSRSYPALLAEDYPPSILVTAVPLISRANPHLVSCGTYYVVENAEGEIVGAGGWTPAAPERSSPLLVIGNVRHLVTDHNHVRRGIGSRLMQRIVEASRAAGLRRLNCLSTRTAEPFYATMGFQRLGVRTIPLQPGIEFPVIAMQMNFRD